MERIDWTQYLDTGETLDSVKASALRHRRSREIQKAAQLKIQPIVVETYKIPPEVEKKMDQFCDSMLEIIKAELGDLTARDEEVATRFAQISYGFDHGVIQTVHSPSGLLVGGVYPEAAARKA